MRALITVIPIIVLILSIAACQGAAGPAGGQGPPGLQGSSGAPGLAGPRGPAGAPALVDDTTVASLIEQMQEQLDTGYTTAAIPPKSTPGDYTEFLVRDAISRYKSEGLDATVAYYNTKESVDGQWYVFMIDENQTIVAHAPNPDLVGKHISQALGPNSYPTGSAVAASADQDGAWFDYTYANPASGVVETKHSWAVIHDGITFGSGWYERGPGKSDAPAYTKAFVQRPRTSTSPSAWRRPSPTTTPRRVLTASGTSSSSMRTRPSSLMPPTPTWWASTSPRLWDPTPTPPGPPSPPPPTRTAPGSTTPMPIPPLALWRPSTPG